MSNKLKGSECVEVRPRSTSHPCQPPPPPPRLPPPLPCRPRRLPAHPSDPTLYVCVEVEAREERRAEWEAGYAEEVLELMSKEAVYRRKRNYQMGSRQFIDSSRRSVCVQLTRFNSNEAVCKSYGPFAGAEHSSSPEEWSAVVQAMEPFGRRARLSRFLVMGRASQQTVDLLTEVSHKWGWATPSLLRAPTPPWLNRQLYTGEAVACLSLSANLAMQACEMGVGAGGVGRRGGGQGGGGRKGVGKGD